MASPRRRIRSPWKTAAAAWLLAPTCVTAATPLPLSGEFICVLAAVGDCDFHDPASRLVFAWPADWPGRRLKLLTETGPRARAQRPGALRSILVEYVPDDPAQPQVALLQVTVLERAEWIGQWTRARAIAPGDVEVASSWNFVAVAWVHAGNPYPPESRDADIWDALRPTAADVSGLVHLADATIRPVSTRAAPRRGGQ